jgi:hypothetical protein
MHDNTAEELLRRVRCEFLEMPGLRLTESQAGKLWGLDKASCSEMLTALVATRFLCQTRQGAFMRSDGAVARRDTGRA